MRHPVESSIMTVNSPQMRKNSFGDFSSFLPDYLELEVLYHYLSKDDFGVLRTIEDIHQSFSSAQ